MKQCLTTLLLVLLGTPSLGFTMQAQAQEYPQGDLTVYRTIRFNNENWLTLPHPKVASFSVHEDGSASGYTETGIFFSQYNVPNHFGIRVQRFEIEDHYHYIVDGEIANSVTELSALLALAYEQTLTS